VELVEVLEVVEDVLVELVVVDVEVEDVVEEDELELEELELEELELEELELELEDDDDTVTWHPQAADAIVAPGVFEVTVKVTVAEADSVPGRNTSEEAPTPK